ncbi:MAG: hypothetical protein IJB70_05840 [Clostridia bacterium]|nr:hypothetical protein [Clostridia bacterium]
MSIFEAGQKIIFENFFVRYEISVEDASVINIIDKVKNVSIKSEDTSFFYFIDEDKETVHVPTAMFLVGDILTVRTKAGNFFVEVTECDNYFTFEITSALPTTAYKLVMAHAKYAYDMEDKKGIKACGISLSYPANPCYFPDCKAKETKAEVLCKMENTKAKYALVAAPIEKIKGILKTACNTIDKENGFYTRIGGAWGRDADVNFQNCIIEENSEINYLKENMPFYKSLGVNQIDFHKAFGNFCQGDFTYINYKDAKDFKDTAVKYLAENGISSGLHTYSHYIDYNSEVIMSVPKWQNQIGILGTYTLSEGVSEDALFLPTIESTANISDNFGFFSRNTEYVLIGDEIIEFENAPNGFKVKRRGCCKTTPKSYREGSKIYHLDGYYQGFCPVIGSELFFHVARETAKAYNEGGYSSIYLDALDGISKHCDDPSEVQYYMAAFVCEVLKYCKKEPLLEASCHYPILWTSRGRIGAWDTCKQGFTLWNNQHAESNKLHIDRYSAPTMGWYDFYPTDEDSKNETVKYQHTNDVETMGKISLVNNFSMVYNDLKYENYKKLPAMQRNIAIYRKYDSLRMSKYFSESYLEKIKNSKYDCHLTETENGFEFVEKVFSAKKLYDLSDTQRNTVTFENPFKAQTPFIRIEAGMSSICKKGSNVLKASETANVCNQIIKKKFKKPLDLSQNRVLAVSVKGNGKKGALAITLGCASHRGVLRFYIDTDFEGERDFLLAESHNGERLDLPFDYPDHPTYPGSYFVGRDPYHYHSTNSVTVESCGDVSGVEMSDIKAYSRIEEVIVNPSVTTDFGKIVFECNLRSGEYLEFDGKCAKLIDFAGNEKEVPFKGKIKTPKGEFGVNVSSESKTKNTLNAKLTLGFEGKIIKK